MVTKVYEQYKPDFVVGRIRKAATKNKTTGTGKYFSVFLLLIRPD